VVEVREGQKAGTGLLVGGPKRREPQAVNKLARRRNVPDSSPTST